MVRINYQYLSHIFAILLVTRTCLGKIPSAEYDGSRVSVCK